MVSNENPSILAEKIESLLDSANLSESYHLRSIAASLELTPRTLRRRLAGQRTSFTEILEKWRCRSAITLLRKNNMTVKNVAIRLGYSHSSNFERAFKRWTGYAPGTYRGKI